MKWFFVIWVSTSSGGFDIMTIPAHTVSAEVAMPSQEVCEAVQLLNRSGECVGKLPKPK